MAEQPRVFEPLRNKASTKGTWTFGCRPDARKRNSSLSRSECRSEGTSAWHSRDVRDAEGSLVGCNHERVRRQIVGRRPTTGQRLVDAVTGDQSTDRHLDTDINVRATSRVFQGGRLVQMHSQAEHRKRHANALIGSTAAYRERGKVKLISSKEARQAPEQFSTQRCWRDGPGWHFSHSCAYQKSCTCA